MPNFSSVKFNPYGSGKVVKLTPKQSLPLLLLIAAVGAAVTFFFGIPMIENAFQSKSWPSVEGVIVVSEFTRHTDSSDGSVTYGADIAYNYAVEGVQYTGKNVSFGGGYNSSDPTHGRDIVNRYPVGQNVSVYYDPADSKASVLEPGAGWSSFMVAGIGGLFTLVGVLGFIFTLRKVMKGKSGEPSQSLPPPLAQ